MATFYAELLRIFRIGKHYGSAFKATNIIGQGCPLSMLWSNLLISTWARALRAHLVNLTLEVRLTAYVDDRTMRAATLATLQAAMSFARYGSDPWARTQCDQIHCVRHSCPAPGVDGAATKPSTWCWMR